MSVIEELYQLVKPVHELDTTKAIDRTKSFLEFLDNPQDTLQNVVHVAGTSGKGTTCYYASELLMHQGLRVGTITSPHVYSVGERAMINLDPNLFDLGDLLHLVEDYTSSHKLGYFEALVGLAIYFFALNKVDVAVIETGLGGRLDGTNVFQQPNKICVLNSIGLDHQQWLGSTIEEIAAEKAGIIAKKSHVIYSANQPKNIKSIFLQKAAKEEAIGHEVKTLEALTLAQPGAHNKLNASLAVEASKQALALIGKDFNSDSLSSLTNLKLPGRFEKVKYKNKILILDGAHNTQKMTALLKQFNSNNTKIFVLDNFQRIGSAVFDDYDFTQIEAVDDQLTAEITRTKKEQILVTGTLKKLSEVKTLLESAI